MKKAFSFQNGFTLVEVLASIAIISVILLGIVQLMNFTNKTATSNNVKLVTTHLAKASIERMKIQPEDFFNKEDINTQAITSDTCSIQQCEQLYRLLINNELYELTLVVNQDEEEKKLRLINVLVTVEHASRGIKSSVEGYVVDEI